MALNSDQHINRLIVNRSNLKIFICCKLEKEKSGNTLCDETKTYLCYKNFINIMHILQVFTYLKFINSILFTIFY